MVEMVGTVVYIGLIAMLVTQIATFGADDDRTRVLLSAKKTRWVMMGRT